MITIELLQKVCPGTKEYLETNDVSKSIVFANKVASVVIQEKGVSVYTE